jgi:hypothetical protein
MNLFRLRNVGALIAGLLLAAPAVAQSDSLFREWLAKAQVGDLKSMQLVADEPGYPTVNHTEALKWFQRAAKQGSVEVGP